MPASDQPLQLGISVPFSRYVQVDPLTHCPLALHPLHSLTRRYAQAIMREVEAWSEDMAGREVGSVCLTMGDMDLFEPPVLDELLACVECNLPLTSNVEVSGRALLTFVRAGDETVMLDVLARRHATVMLDMPSFDRDECEIMTFPTRFVGLEALMDRMRRAGVEDIGLVLVGDSGHRDERSWGSHLEHVLELAPTYVDIEIWRKVFKAPGLETFRAGLVQAGYVEYAPNRYGRDGAALRYSADVDPTVEYLGVGCAARSHFGGCYTENIDGIDEYIGANGILEHTIRKVVFDDGRSAERV